MLSSEPLLTPLSLRWSMRNVFSFSKFASRLTLLLDHFWYKKDFEKYKFSTENSKSFLIKYITLYKYRILRKAKEANVYWNHVHCETIAGFTVCFLNSFESNIFLKSILNRKPVETRAGPWGWSTHRFWPHLTFYKFWKIITR